MDLNGSTSMTQRFKSAVSDPLKNLTELSFGAPVSSSVSRGPVASSSRAILLEIDSYFRECERRESGCEIDVDAVKDVLCDLLSGLNSFDDHAIMTDMVLPSLLRTLQSLNAAHCRFPVLDSLVWVLSVCGNEQAAVCQVIEALHGVIANKSLRSSDALKIGDMAMSLPSGTESTRLLLSILSVVSQEHLTILLRQFLISLPDGHDANEPVAYYLRTSLLSEQLFQANRQTFKSTLSVLFSCLDDVLIGQTLSRFYVTSVGEESTRWTIADFGVVLWLLSSTKHNALGQDTIDTALQRNRNLVFPDVMKCLSFYLNEKMWRTRMVDSISRLTIRIAKAEARGSRLSEAVSASVKCMITETFQTMNSLQQAELVASLVALRKEYHYQRHPALKQNNKPHSHTFNEQGGNTSVADDVVKVIVAFSSPPAAEMLTEQMLSLLWDDACGDRGNLLTSTSDILVRLMESSHVTELYLTNVVQKLLSTGQQHEETDNSTPTNRGRCQRWRGVILARAMLKSKALSRMGCLALEKLVLRALLPPCWKGVDPEVGLVAFDTMSLLALRSQGQTEMNLADIKTIVSDTELLDHGEPTKEGNAETILGYATILPIFMSGVRELKKQRTLVLAVNTYAKQVGCVSWSCVMDWVFSLFDHYFLAIRKGAVTKGEAWDPTSLLLAGMQLPNVAGLITLKGSGSAVTNMQSLLNALAEFELDVSRRDQRVPFESAIRVMMKQRTRDLRVIVDVLKSFALSTLVGLSTLQVILKHAAIEWQSNNPSTTLLRLLQFQLAKFCDMQQRLWIFNFFVAATSSAMKRGIARSGGKTGRTQTNMCTLLAQLQRIKANVNSLSRERCWRDPKCMLVCILASGDSLLLQNAFESTLSTASEGLAAVRDLVILRQLLLDYLIDGVPVHALCAVADADVSTFLELALTMGSKLSGYIDAVGRGQITKAPPSSSVVHLASLSLEFVSHFLSNRLAKGEILQRFSKIVPGRSSQAYEQGDDDIFAVYGALSNCLTFGEDEIYAIAARVLGCMAVLSQNSPRLREQTIASCWKVLRTAYCDEIEDQAISWRIPVAVRSFLRLQIGRHCCEANYAEGQSTAIGTLEKFALQVPRHYVEQETSASVVLLLWMLCFSSGRQHRDLLVKTFTAESENFTQSSPNCLSSPIFSCLDKPSRGFFYEIGILLVGVQIEQSRCDEGLPYFGRMLKVYRLDFAKMENRIATTVLDVIRAVQRAVETFLLSVEVRSATEATNRLPDLIHHVCDPIFTFCNFVNDNVGETSVDRFRRTHGCLLEQILKRLSTTCVKAEEIASRFNLPTPSCQIQRTKKLWLDWTSEEEEEEDEWQTAKAKSLAESSFEQRANQKRTIVSTSGDNDTDSCSTHVDCENEKTSSGCKSDETSVSSADESFVAAGDWGQY